MNKLNYERKPTKSVLDRIIEESPDDVDKVYDYLNRSPYVDSLSYDGWAWCVNNQIEHPKLNDAAIRVFKSFQYRDFGTDYGIAELEHPILVYLKKSTSALDDFKLLDQCYKGPKGELSGLKLLSDMLVSLKFRLLYETWFHSISERLDDFSLTALDIKRIACFFNNEYAPVGKIDFWLDRMNVEQTQFFVDNLIHDKLFLNLNNLRFHPFIENMNCFESVPIFERCEILDLNKTPSDCHFSDKFMLFVLLDLYKRMPSLFSNGVTRWQPEAVDGKIQETPLSKALLAVAILITESTDLYNDSGSKTKIEKVFPGITDPVSREQIKKEYFGATSTAFDLNSIYTNHDIVNMLCTEIQVEDICMELPLL